LPLQVPAKPHSLLTKHLVKKRARFNYHLHTQANEEEIRRKFIKLNKCIPQNITVQTWFSLLLKTWCKTISGLQIKKEIKRLVLYNGISAKGIAETNTERHYFTGNLNIYSDKLSKFVVQCNTLSKGSVLDRLSRIYTDLYIDEVQDLAGYDLEFLKLLFKSSINTLLVGDPRQGTYSTNNSLKNKRFKKSQIVNFFEDNTIKIDTDDSSLVINYRSCPSICDLSNKLYPSFKVTTSGNSTITGHDGIFLVKKGDVDTYLKNYNPVQLRDSIRTPVNESYNVITFGNLKD